MTRICREAGGRVRTNMLVRDMDVQAPLVGDSRRLEVVVDGLPVRGGAQVAVDTTSVCALHRDGAPSTWSRRQKWCGPPDRPKKKRGHVPRVFWARATSTLGGRGDRGGRQVVRGNKGIPQWIGDRARTQRNSSDEEARRTGLANAMGRHARVRSGSRGCFVPVGFDPFPWRGWQCSCST